MEANVDRDELINFVTEIYELLHQYHPNRHTFIVKYVYGVVTVGNFSKKGSYTPYYYDLSTQHDYDGLLHAIIDLYINFLYTLTRYTNTGNYMIHYNYHKRRISICRLANQISGREIYTTQI